MLDQAIITVDACATSSPQNENISTVTHSDQIQFKILRTFVTRATIYFEFGDVTAPNLIARLDALELDSLYWAPEMFQYKLSFYIENLCVILNEKFADHDDVATAWGEFLVNWEVARNTDVIHKFSASESTSK